ncbi:NAD(P)-dependent oxidoreductase [Sphingobium sp. 15-1]|uniref:NAD-dependent epimerase/dehydratase family protein n=1 Tax=Sphingobium sp. 15-1 TaxID=2729616 RepID=UPI001C3F5711
MTGAGGYIGTHVVRALADRGTEVLALHRGNAQIDSRAREIVSDFALLDVGKLVAEEGLECVVHLAWSDGFSHDSPAHIDNLPDHVRFVRALVDAGVRHFVGLGTMHEVGYWEGMITEASPNAPRSLYGIAKNALREAARLEIVKAGGVFQWLRVYYILGDDQRNKSLFSKIIGWEAEGKESFPFTMGLSKHDFIQVDDLADQIAQAALQSAVTGVIDCCSGEPVALRDKVEQFIAGQGLAIRPQYGAFPDRAYDSPAVWGSREKIDLILSGT